MPSTTDNINLTINYQEILKNIGYDSGPTAPVRMLRLVNELAKENLDISRPAYVYSIRDIIDVTGDNILIDGGVQLGSRMLADMLDNCCKVAMYVLTIGDGLEAAASRLVQDGSVLKASILEAIGSNAAENVAGLLEDRISYEVSNQGLYTGRRFSPGYCDWPVDQQEMLFKAMEGNSAGVELTEGYLMIPRKSISGIIGIGTWDSGIRDYNPCTTCLKAACPGRRK